MPGRRVRRVAGIVGGLLILALAGAGGAAHRFANDRDPPNPAKPPPDLLRLFSDTRLVRVTTTTPSWTKVEGTVTVDRLRTDLTLWRRIAQPPRALHPHPTGLADVAVPDGRNQAAEFVIV